MVSHTFWRFEESQLFAVILQYKVFIPIMLCICNFLVPPRSRLLSGAFSDRYKAKLNPLRF